MPEINEQLISTIRSMVAGGDSTDRVRSNLQMFGMSTVEIDSVLDEYQARVGRVRTLRRPVSFRGPTLTDWYPGPHADDTFWPPLRELLVDKGWGENVVGSVDDASTKIMSHLQPTGVTEFRTRGLVLGYVQSGKTTNFTALISKASDVGYKLFIVLSGVHNKLRKQTQERLRTELVDLNREHWIEITDPNSDFTIQGVGNVDSFLTRHNDQRVLGVVKKNATVLNRLKNWLGGASAQVMNSCPILIIDDEADQASLNTGKDAERRSRINELLIQILKAGPKIAYVGYTATPFANLFVDPTIPPDLYPSDFIVDLPRPDGYFGAEALFGREPIDADDTDPSVDGLDLIRTVPMDELGGLKPGSRDSRFDFVPEITPSLRDALLYFWMATAARRSRGDSDHASMLVHTTLYVDSHLQIQTAIETFRKQTLDRLRDADPALVEDLEIQWADEQARVDLPSGSPRRTPFTTVLSGMERVLSETTVPVENNQSLQRLTFEEPGTTQIVVGGNVLSRGLTLEGLTVSYFVRTSTAYDTLLQMGRWFGYRFGYEELPRVWMTDELQRYFHDLATVEREIRADIARYEDEDLTPTDFAVRVRTHPKMSITAKAKMSAAIPIQVSYNGQRLQTILFNTRDRDWLIQNQNAARSLVKRIVSGGGSFSESLETYRVARGVSSDSILGFLHQYQVQEEASDIRTGLMADYIVGRNQDGELHEWNVVLAGQSEDRCGEFDFGSGVSVPMVERSQLPGYGDREHTSIGTLLVSTDWVADLESIPTRRELTRMTSAALSKMRLEHDHGTLILYPIARDSRPGSTGKRLELNALEDVLGIGVVFPESEHVEPMTYVSVDLSSLRGEEYELPEEEEGSTDV